MITTQTTQLEVRLFAAKEVALLAGDLITKDPEEQAKLSYKGKSDVVTQMDGACERFIKEYLHKKFPQDNFVGEEAGQQNYGTGGRWIIDPIDGTSNYVHNIPGFTISIAYEEELYQPLLGVVYSPIHQELYYAQRGMGAFCNGKQIYVSDTSNINEALTITSPPLRIPSLMPCYMKLYEKMCLETGDMRNFGSASLHCCYVASGKAEAYLEYGIKYHDVAAGFVLVLEAGGTYSHFESIESVESIEGDVDKAFNGNIIVANKGVHLWYTFATQEVKNNYSETLHCKKILS